MSFKVLSEVLLGVVVRNVRHDGGEVGGETGDFGALENFLFFEVFPVYHAEGEDEEDYEVEGNN